MSPNFKILPSIALMTVGENIQKRCRKRRQCKRKRKERGKVIERWKIKKMKMCSKRGKDK
jgi:hypothetical protein